MRGCLLKECEQKFFRCREAARKWARWNAQQGYQATTPGNQKRYWHAGLKK